VLATATSDAVGRDELLAGTRRAGTAHQQRRQLFPARRRHGNSKRDVIQTLPDLVFRVLSLRRRT